MVIKGSGTEARYPQGGDRSLEYFDRINCSILVFFGNQAQNLKRRSQICNKNSKKSDESNI